MSINGNHQAAQRIVIDTNVCIDLFVFHDPRWVNLRTALEDGSVVAVTRDDCRREFRYVLHYPHLPLDDDRRADAAAQFDRLMHCLSIDDWVEPPESSRLPVCKDKQDQKFLQTAAQAQANMLITKDKDLLKLAKRSARLGQVRIVLPELWLAEWMSAKIDSPTSASSTSSIKQ